MFKDCTKCLENKPIEQFYFVKKVNKACSWCKLCINKKNKEWDKDKKKAMDKAYRENPENKQKIKDAQSEYYQKHKNNHEYKERAKKHSTTFQKSEKGKDYQFQYREENKEHRKEIIKNWTVNNRAKLTAKQNKRRAQKLKATPPWLTEEHLKEIEEFYVLAKELSWLFEGEPLEVDHIVPLQGKEVRGLHVPWNLQILTESANCKKGNR